MPVFVSVSAALGRAARVTASQRRGCRGVACREAIVGAPHGLRLVEMAPAGPVGVDDAGLGVHQNDPDRLEKNSSPTKLSEVKGSSRSTNHPAVAVGLIATYCVS
jgi:hypothetical protein